MVFFIEFRIFKKRIYDILVDDSSVCLLVCIYSLPKKSFYFPHLGRIQEQKLGKVCQIRAVIGFVPVILGVLSSNILIASSR